MDAHLIGQDANGRVMKCTGIDTVVFAQKFRTYDMDTLLHILLFNSQT